MHASLCLYVGLVALCGGNSVSTPLHGKTNALRLFARNRATVYHNNLFCSAGKVVHLHPLSSFFPNFEGKMLIVKL